jgi:ligand-binding sensor domain-containing protein
MKIAITLTVFFIFVTCLKIPCFADEAWELAPGINEADLKQIAIDNLTNNIYVASEKTIYKSQDSGNVWTIVFSASAEDNVINFITVKKGDIFVCAKSGLFRSDNSCLDWKKIFKGIGDKENSVSHIAFSKDKEIYIATDGGLFISNDNGVTWSKDSLKEVGDGVKWVEFLDEIIFIATEKGVYKNSGVGWKRTFVTKREDIEYDVNIADESVKAPKPVNSMAINKDIIFLATDSGIFISKDKGETWKSFINTGLISLHIKCILFTDILYALTDKGIFVFLDRDKLWQSLYKGMATKEASSMALDPDGNIWVTTKKGLYKRRQN